MKYTSQGGPMGAWKEALLGQKKKMLSLENFVFLSDFGNELGLNFGGV